MLRALTYTENTEILFLWTFASKTWCELILGKKNPMGNTYRQDTFRHVLSKATVRTLKVTGKQKP